MTTITPAQQYWCVIPAAGIGQRMGADCPKQYLPLGDRTIIEHTLARLLDHPAIAGVVVAVAEQDARWQALTLNDPRIHTVIGGEERADSVAAGLAWLGERIDAAQWVLVHDAARPLVTHAELDQLMAVCEKGSGAVLGSPVRDTMKRTASDHRVAATVDRDQLWHAFTPQMFRLGELRSGADPGAGSRASGH